ncbi:MAG: WG repeat-containing protein, partial [Bacteroidota bacterium]|nr:WG repeat-containing protein [Bacteroidota bacterium]
AIPIKYESIAFNENIAVAKINGKFGAINKNNQIVIPFEYDYLVDFSEEVAYAQKNGKTFFIDIDNKILFYHNYEWGLCFEEGLSIIKENDKLGCMDINGNIVIPFEYDRIVFIEGLIAVRKNRLYGVINHNGDIIVPFEYDAMGGYSNGLAPVKKNNKWGYVDKFGNIIIPNTFEYVTSFFKVKTNIDNANPTIAITFPTSTYQKTQNSQFTIKGTVTDDTGISEFKINNSIINLNGSNFSYTTQLSNGQNIFNLIATDNSGNTTPKQIIITYQPQQTDKTGPNIKITQPDLNRGFIVIEPMQYEIKGTVNDPSGVIQVLVNNEPANVDAQGNFSKKVVLIFGENNFTITATDKYNNTSVPINFSITRKSQDEVIIDDENEIENLGKYYALIIGVSNYIDPKIPDLNNEPTKDAKELKSILTTYYTFEEQNITLLLNPTNSEIIRKFDDLNKIITENDNLLIFYAGHGYYEAESDLGYWLPSNADKNYTDKWIYNDVLVASIKKIKSKHTLLISDACFSGSIFRNVNNDITDLSYQKKYALKSRNAITSGTLKTVPNKSIFFDYLS